MDTAARIFAGPEPGTVAERLEHIAEALEWTARGVRLDAVMLDIEAAGPAFDAHIAQLKTAVDMLRALRAQEA